MRLLKKIHIKALRKFYLIWPYDLSLLKVLGVLSLLIFTYLQIERSFYSKEVLSESQISPLYLDLFSGSNPMIEFNYEFSDYYAFPKVHQAFGPIKIDSIQKFNKEEFQALILLTVPRELRSKIEGYLSFTLETAQKYQVDPFWLLAVMWTESHFEHFSLSPLNAIGLMQIVPETGHFITSKILGKSISKQNIRSYVEEPFINIELGTIYLKKLLTRFRYNYRLATVAYNLGPTRVLDRLSGGIPVGYQNEYMDKVTESYQKLIKSFLLALTEKRSPLENSFVFMKTPERAIEFFTMVPFDLSRAIDLKQRRALARIPSWQIISYVH